MQTQPGRTIEIADVLRQHELSRTLVATLPRVDGAALLEDLGLYLMLAAFWAVVLYAALTYALP